MLVNNCWRISSATGTSVWITMFSGVLYSFLPVVHHFQLTARNWAVLLSVESWMSSNGPRLQSQIINDVCDHLWFMPILSSVACRNASEVQSERGIGYCCLMFDLFDSLKQLNYWMGLFHLWTCLVAPGLNRLYGSGVWKKRIVLFCCFTVVC